MISIYKKKSWVYNTPIEAGRDGRRGVCVRS